MLPKPCPTPAPVAGRWLTSTTANPRSALQALTAAPVGGPTVLQVGATILACPAGSVATGDYGCQPVQMPDTSDIQTIIDVPNSTNELVLYTEVAVQPQTGGWCTTNEGSGTPALRRQTPASNSRAVIVANGRVCFINGTLFLATQNSTDPATSRAAVNLAMPQAGLPPPNPLGDIGTDFIYGDPGKIIPSAGREDRPASDGRGRQPAAHSQHASQYRIVCRLLEPGAADHQ